MAASLSEAGGASPSSPSCSKMVSPLIVASLASTVVGCCPRRTTTRASKPHIATARAIAVKRDRRGCGFLLGDTNWSMPAAVGLRSAEAAPPVLGPREAQQQQQAANNKQTYSSSSSSSSKQQAAERRKRRQSVAGVAARPAEPRCNSLRPKSVTVKNGPLRVEPKTGVVVESRCHWG